jgi:MmyB-like transcription regulator ligand binding domain
VDWEKEAADMLGRFRTAAARRLDDPEFTDLIERLHQASRRSAAGGRATTCGRRCRSRVV